MKKSARDFLSAERRGFSALSAANCPALRPVKGCPANAGQACIFAGHRNVLGAQRIPAKGERHAGRFLYVPLPVVAAVEAIQTAVFGNILETSWKPSR
jgi:hypothetical protein